MKVLILALLVFASLSVAAIWNSSYGNTLNLYPANSSPFIYTVSINTSTITNSTVIVPIVEIDIVNETKCYNKTIGYNTTYIKIYTPVRCSGSGVVNDSSASLSLIRKANCSLNNSMNKTHLVYVWDGDYNSVESPIYNLTCESQPKQNCINTTRNVCSNIFNFTTWNYQTICKNITGQNCTPQTSNHTNYIQSIISRLTYRLVNKTVINESLLLLKHEDTLTKYTSSVCLVGSNCNPDNYTANTVGIQSATNGFVVAGQDYAEIVNKSAIENISNGDVICLNTGAMATKTFTTTCMDWGVASGSTAGFIGGSKTSDLYQIVNGTKVMKNDFTGATHVPMAFTGLIKVKVTGTCSASNWLVPSTTAGYAKCVNISTVSSVTALATNMLQKIGIAWETNTSAGNKTILARVGAR